MNSSSENLRRAEVSQTTECSLFFRPTSIIPAPSFTEDTDATSKTAVSSFKNDVQAIFEDEASSSSRQDQAVSRPPIIPVTTGPGVVPYLKPGLRVVRGPDWKWGDQVIYFCFLRHKNSLFSLTTNLCTG